MGHSTGRVSFGEKTPAKAPSEKPSAFDKENRPKLIGAAALLFVVLVFFAYRFGALGGGDQEAAQSASEAARRSARRPVRKPREPDAPHPPGRAPTHALRQVDPAARRQLTRPGPRAYAAPVCAPLTPLGLRESRRPARTCHGLPLADPPLRARDRARSLPRCLEMTSAASSADSSR